MNVSPLVGRPGAVQLEGGAVAVHYGDPLREQRLLAEGAGLVDRSDRDVLAIPGADRLTWLHSLTSQHLDRLADASGSEALVLSPNGHVEHHLVLADLAGTTWADTEPGTGAALVEFLQKMRFMLRVDPTLVTRTGPCCRWWARRRTGSWPPRGLPTPDHEYAVPRWSRASSAACPRSATAARRCSTSSSPEPSIEAVGRPARRRAWSRVSPLTRRSASRPAVPASVSTATTGRSRTSCSGCRPPSTWTRAATAARRPWRGCTTWAARRDGWSCCTWTASARCWPSPGRRCSAGTREVGRVGSVVRHHELGVIALALVKQSVAMDAALTVAGSTASIDPDDAPADADDTLVAARERVRAVRSATIGR